MLKDHLEELDHAFEGLNELNFDLPELDGLLSMELIDDPVDWDALDQMLVEHGVVLLTPEGIFDVSGA